MTAEPGSEPIQGKELIRLGLETYQVRFELEDWGLMSERHSG
ncbi:MAG TPA: hypothetical protein VFE34_11595 [Dongiaceae bacterium]|jgi:hypothetical protein|nr:hypothetical protein [Dongiaceae bacterium]